MKYEGRGEMKEPPSGSFQENPCVWVMAGVLSYRRPCHRNYECEGCELNQALQGLAMGEEGGSERSHPPQMDEVVSAYIVQLTEGCDLHLDRPYSRGHFWIKEESQDEVLLGFDCQTIRIIFPLDDLLLPKPGTWLRRGEPMGWIQRGHMTLPLHAPMSGEVLEVNEGLVQELKEDGFPRSRIRWLIRLKPHEPVGDVPGLLRGESMLSWYQKKLGLVRSYLKVAADPGVDAGRTMNDGGELNRNLEQVLGSDHFQELMDRLFQDLD
jgi:glycine cleavage system H lipoate-binding protein